MSAYLVALAHMDALIAYGAMATEAPRHLSPLVLTVPADADCADGAPVTINFADPEHRNDIGRILFEANAESLAARYGADDDAAKLGFVLAERYTFKPSTAPTEPARIIGAADCFDYQACEHDGWNMSLAQWIVGAIRNKAARELAQGWEFTDDARDADLETMTAPAAGGDDGETEPTPRSAMLSRMAAALSGEALPDPATATAPEPEGPIAPKPEPEAVAKAAAKAKAPKPAGKAAKGRKAATNKASGARAKPPAKKNAAAPRAKGRAPTKA